MDRQYRLSQEIIKLSNASSWDEARPEWEVGDIYRVRTKRACLCGHFPITKLCILRNKKNGREATLGSVCVLKFLEVDLGTLFDAIGRIQEDDKKALNAKMIDHAHDRGWLNDWERKFYLDTLRKKKLSKKQLDTRVKLNRKVLAKADFER